MNYQALTTAVRDAVLDTYQAESLTGLFPSVPIPKGIAAEKWAQKYIIETKRAGVHHRGFNPNTITMDFKGFEVTPVTIDQQALMDEIAQAQFVETGLFDKFIPEMGKNMAYTSNTWIMRHIGGNGESAPFTEYHYILADGDGSNGTAAQPLWLYDAATAGGWGTWANVMTDISRLKGHFIAKGGNLASALVLLPKVAAPIFIKPISEYQGKSIETYLSEQGLRYMYVEDAYFYTQAGAIPTEILFDMVLLDTSEFIIGYQREERTRVIPPYADVRDTKIEAEVWFAMLCVPFRKNEEGTIKTYKSASRIRAIAP
jgi:hypothetical protein